MASWPALVDAVSAAVDLSETARATKALVRPRKVRSATALLRLALMYGAGKLSLRAVAAEATALKVASLSDVAVLKRLRRCGDWLALILDHLLAAVPRLALVDGSTVSVPNSQGSDWRQHVRDEPAAGRFIDLVLTDASTAEGLSSMAVSPGDVIVADRGDARVRNFAHLQAVGSDFIARIGGRSVKLFEAQGQPFDPLAALPPPGVAVVEHAVQIGRAVTSARLAIQRIPGAQVARQHARLHRKASRHGHQTDPRTTLAAGSLMLLTSLPAALYRLRWQIELAFKRLKSVGGFGDLPAADPALARSWLLAHLIVAVLSEDLARQGLDFPPRAAGIGSPPPPRPLAGGQARLATRGAGAVPPHHAPQRPAASPRHTHAWHTHTDAGSAKKVSHETHYVIPTREKKNSPGVVSDPR